MKVMKKVYVAPKIETLIVSTHVMDSMSMSIYENEEAVDNPDAVLSRRMWSQSAFDDED